MWDINTLCTTRCLRDPLIVIKKLKCFFMISWLNVAIKQDTLNDNAKNNERTRTIRPKSIRPKSNQLATIQPSRKGAWRILGDMPRTRERPRERRRRSKIRRGGFNSDFKKAHRAHRTTGRETRAKKSASASARNPNPNHRRCSARTGTKGKNAGGAPSR